MPVDPNLNFDFDPADKATIIAALDSILTVLNSPTVPYVGLSPTERKIPSIGAKRMPYVTDAIENILPNFPALASPSIGLPRVVLLAALIEFAAVVKPKIDEINDRLTDLGINAENIIYKSLLDSYNTAKQQEGRMSGADVLVAAIKPLFEGQGKINPPA